MWNECVNFNCHLKSSRINEDDDDNDDGDVVVMDEKDVRMCRQHTRGKQIAEWCANRFEINKRSRLIWNQTTNVKGSVLFARLMQWRWIHTVSGREVVIKLFYKTHK